MRTNLILVRPVLFVVLMAAFAASVTCAFLLRFDFGLPVRYRQFLLFALIAWPAIKLVVYTVGGFGHGWWRHVSLPDILRLARVNVIASIFVTLAALCFAPAGFPRSIYILDFLVCLALTCALRVSRRVYWEFAQDGKRELARSRTLIYGAGDAGVSLVRELRQNPALLYEPVGFLDDDRGKRGSSVLGVKVLGSGADLAGLARKHEVQTVLVAIPSAQGPEMTRILRQCREANVAFKTVPSLGEILEQDGLARQIRDVNVEDLLSRAPVRLDITAIDRSLAGMTVLVTGAGGSIGAEMCRQVAGHAPAAIIGLDIAETPLFQIEAEMRRRFPQIPFHPEIGSIANAQRVAEVLDRHRPQVVFHAAAYKHVPMMEAHAFEAIENNVFGTFHLAAAAIRAGVREFVMISTDKAVRPTNIMGASKRVAETVIQALNGIGSAATRFVAVRFGNVLGSNGSVVPTFVEQIRKGGPVTVTHPEVRRFFMTIPEAAQLVLQAAAMSQTAGRGGEVFVLDMGESVKIADLARNLILLSGLKPDDDIAIEFTGLRPGEKLYEELAHLDEGTVPTSHDRVRVFQGPHLSESALTPHMQRLQDACRVRDLRSLIFELKELVPDYNPSTHILRQMLAPAPVPPVSPPAPLVHSASA